MSSDKNNTVNTTSYIPSPKAIDSLTKLDLSEGEKKLFFAKEYIKEVINQYEKKEIENSQTAAYLICGLMGDYEIYENEKFNEILSLASNLELEVGSILSEEEYEREWNTFIDKIKEL